MIARGLVIPGVLGHGEIANLAARAEERGYTSVWVTVPSSENEPGELLRVALEATTRVEVGLGVVPLDRFSASSMHAKISAVREAYDRVVVGVGVGSVAAGAASIVEREVHRLKELEPALRVGVGTYNAAVLETAGREADALVLNWMTPERLRWAIAQAAGGAERAGRRPPLVYLYVSSAVGHAAADTIDAALAAFRQYPYHRRHQEALAAQETVGAAVESASEVDVALACYDGAIPVVNAVGATTVSERRRVLDVFAPAG